MLANKGVYGSQRLIGETALLTGLLSPSRPDDQPFFFVGPFSAESHAGPQRWSAGALSGVQDGKLLPFPTRPSTVSWSGYWGTGYAFDPSTGFYTVGANGQQDLSARLVSNIRDDSRGNPPSVGTNTMGLLHSSTAFATKETCAA